MVEVSTDESTRYGASTRRALTIILIRIAPSVKPKARANKLEMNTGRRLECEVEK